MDKRALLREHRKHVVGIADGRSVTITEGKYTSLTCNNSSENLDCARGAIANGIVAVLPEARTSVAAWLTHSESRAHEGSDLSNLTFGQLGGTSLLAVEVAWRSSHSVAWLNTSAAAQAPSRLILTADDFLRGTLEETAIALHRTLQMKSWWVHARSSSATAVGSGAVGLVAVDDESVESLALPAGPLEQSPRGASPASPQLEHFSHAGRKRRRPEARERGEVVHSRPFVAVGRAGAGVRHSPSCLGGETGIAGEGRGSEGTRVELSTRWSSCLSKCIDASPLLVIPNGRRGGAGRPRTECSYKAGDMVDETPVQSDLPTCCCHSKPGGSCPAHIAKGSVSGKSTLCEDLRDSAPQAEPGTVYIGSHSGEFQALNLATGEREWSFAANGRIESGAACSSDGLMVFVGCHDRHLYAIDRRMGNLSWSFETGDAIKCTPVCMPVVPCPDSYEGRTREKGLPGNYGNVLVGSHDGILRSLQEGDGELRWSFDCGGALFASPALSADARVVYAATTKGRVVALDGSALISAGTKAFDSATDAGRRHKRRGLSLKQPAIRWDIRLPAPCFSTPTVCDSDGNVVVGCVDGGLYCLSSNGEQVWVCHQGKKPVFSSPCLLPSMRKETGRSGNHEVGMRVIWGCHDG